MEKTDLYKKVSAARYGEDLAEVANELDVVEVLYLDVNDDWQGSVDIDALLRDGRVWSYRYDYGSCSGCDEWEANDLSDVEIRLDMAKGSTFFDDLNQYNEWAKTARTSAVDEDEEF